MRFEHQINYGIDELIDQSLSQLDYELNHLLSDIKVSLNEDTRRNFEPAFVKIYDKYIDKYGDLAQSKKSEFELIIKETAKQNAIIISNDLDNIDKEKPYSHNTYTKKYIQKRTANLEYNRKTKSVIIKVAYQQFKNVYLTKANEILSDRFEFYKLNVNIRLDNAFMEYSKIKKDILEVKRIEQQRLKSKEELLNFNKLEQGVAKIYEDKSDTDRLSDDLNELMKEIEVDNPVTDNVFSVTTPLDKVDDLFNRLEAMDTDSDVKFDVDYSTAQLLDEDTGIDSIREEVKNLNTTTSVKEKTITESDKESLVAILTGDLAHEVDKIEKDGYEHTEITNIDVEIEKPLKHLSKKFLSAVGETFIIVIIIIIVFYLLIEFI